MPSQTLSTSYVRTPSPLHQRLLDTWEAGRVTRYHAAPSVQPQNVAHHSWNVAVIVLYLTDRQASGDLLRECLMHDTAEFFTGDIPFTVKREHADLKERFDQLEVEARELDLMLPSSKLTEQEWALLKLADTLDGVMWCAKNEHHSGPVGGRWGHAFHVAMRKFATVLTLEQLNRARELFNLVTT